MILELLEGQFDLFELILGILAIGDQQLDAVILVLIDLHHEQKLARSNNILFNLKRVAAHLDLFLGLEKVVGIVEVHVCVPLVHILRAFGPGVVRNKNPLLRDVLVVSPVLQLVEVKRRTLAQANSKMYSAIWSQFSPTSWLR